ncbi:MAG TPA: hypothetical protein VMA72_04335 [Streptosporangiaceae bacterium]|nr:hypothetical protein [Streptosporangiaceae bacterium]
MRALAGAVAALVMASSLALATTSPASGSGGGCDPYVDGTVILVPCWFGAGARDDTPGGGGSALNDTCTFTALAEAQAKSIGVSWPPPRGKHWALMDCGTGTGPQAVLVPDATGARPVTPRQLVNALGGLDVPHLRPATAPPRGTAGLVGLPEWFWVPAAKWHVRSVTVTAGPVWATVTATPVSLTVQPGAGLSPVTCAGPGTAYNRRKPAAQQHTDCSYTYLQPSAGLPGSAYRASVTATWRVTWTGSGDTGGVLDPALAVPVGFAIGVAQGEALVTSQ